LYPRKLSAERLHCIFGHIGAERVSYLETAVEGVRMESGTKALILSECDTCSQSKARRIISRRGRIKQRLPAPFSDISVDILEFNQAFNGDRYMVHSYDEATKMHFVWTMASANQLALVECY
jgi:hypothetical protein